MPAARFVWKTGLTIIGLVQIVPSNDLIVTPTSHQVDTGVYAFVSLDVPYCGLDTVITATIYETSDCSGDPTDTFSAVNGVCTDLGDGDEFYKLTVKIFSIPTHHTSFNFASQRCSSLVLLDSTCLIDSANIPSKAAASCGFRVHVRIVSFRGKVFCAFTDLTRLPYVQIFSIVLLSQIFHGHFC